MSFIPNSMDGFKDSPYYLLKQMLKKYEGLHPSAKSLPHTFKKQHVFRRSDTQVLHTRETWKKEGRQVREGEKPVKEVKSIMSETGKTTDLFGYWQTVEFKVGLAADGSLPRNQYGNHEVFLGLPPGSIHLKMPAVSATCRKLGLEFVHAVTGFENAKGRAIAVKEGVITWAKHEEQILEAHEKFAAEREEKRIENRKKNLRLVWKQLFKNILVKKYMSEKYDCGEL